MEEKKQSFSFAKGSTSILKGENSDIGSTGVLYQKHTGETGVLSGSIPPNVYNSVSSYEGAKANAGTSGSKSGKVVIVVLIGILLVVAIGAGLKLAGVL